MTQSMPVTLLLVYYYFGTFVPQNVEVKNLTTCRLSTDPFYSPFSSPYFKPLHWKMHSLFFILRTFHFYIE
jgi:hypothetical protein